MPLWQNTWSGAIYKEKRFIWLTVVESQRHRPGTSLASPWASRQKVSGCRSGTCGEGTEQKCQAYSLKTCSCKKSHIFSAMALTPPERWCSHDVLTHYSSTNSHHHGIGNKASTQVSLRAEHTQTTGVPKIYNRKGNITGKPCYPHEEFHRDIVGMKKSRAEPALWNIGPWRWPWRLTPATCVPGLKEVPGCWLRPDQPRPSRPFTDWPNTMEDLVSIPFLSFPVSLTLPFKYMK